jgi:hypothetical protein
MRWTDFIPQGLKKAREFCTCIQGIPYTDRFDCGQLALDLAAKSGVKLSTSFPQGLKKAREFRTYIQGILYVYNFVVENFVDNLHKLSYCVIVT